MKKIINASYSAILLVFVLLIPYIVLAGNSDASPADRLVSFGKNSGFKQANEGTAFGIVGTVIAVFTSLLGIVFLGLFLYAGTMWMIAAGDESKISKAKDTMRRAIIGLIIVVAAYAISQFVVLALTT